MIHAEQFVQALHALGRLLIHAKSRAHDSGNVELAELLNDLEMLPEYIADESDRTEELLAMLRGIVRVHPSCRYVMEEFERTTVGSVTE